MTCSRCLGLMIEDQFLDLEGAYGEMWTTSWRSTRKHQDLLRRSPTWIRVFYQASGLTKPEAAGTGKFIWPRTRL